MTTSNFSVAINYNSIYLNIIGLHLISCFLNYNTKMNIIYDINYYVCTIKL